MTLDDDDCDTFDDDNDEDDGGGCDDYADIVHDYADSAVCPCD